MNENSYKEYEMIEEELNDRIKLAKEIIHLV